MNILLINHYAGSLKHGMEYRPFYLGREWTRQGHRVHIAAASASHVRSVSPAIKRNVTEETIDGIHYFWFKTPVYDGNGLRRALNIFSFVGQLLLHHRWLARTMKPDVVIASSTYPLDTIAARAIARQAGARLVFEVHDLWPLSPIELGGMSRRHPFIMLMQWAEDFAYRSADKVVSMLPKTMEYMVTHGMQPEKFAYIPNGVDVAEWQAPSIPPPQTHQVLSQLRSEGCFLVGYAGAHGLANALDHFVDAAFQLQGYPVRFVLIGQGPEKDRLITRVQSRKQTNVIFLPSVPKTSIPAVLEEMDALYIGLKGDPLFRFGVSPNKLMDYMMAAKPVIYAIRSGNDMVAESECGISISPECPDEIVSAVLQLIRLPESEREQMGRRGRDYIQAHHDYRILAKQFLHAANGLSQ
jgi:glycosyltransferase involved in cell wall biosynthesis